MDKKFIEDNKSNPKDFSRNRKLPFIDVFILILRHSVKSLQLILNEFVLPRKKDYSVTASAFSQARQKLKHTAFKELNDDIVSLYYQKEQPIKTHFGFRLLAFDGSKLILPKREELKIAFGSKPIGNHTGKELGEYYVTTFEACYDVLNHIAVKCMLGPGVCYEPQLAKKMLDELTENDLLIYDRGYTSYEFIAELAKRNLNYLIRCSKSTFAAAKNMFKEDSATDVIANVVVPTKHAKRLRKLGFKNKMKVRFVKIILRSGEIEILATSLLDQNKFKQDDFQQLYFFRWGAETFFSKIKSRLGLENFSGKNVEAVKQDFWSTILMSNLETILTEDLEEGLNLNREENTLKQAVNKAVAFNAIKNLAFEILSSDEDKDTVFEKLTRLFLVNKQVIRPNRNMPRYKISDTRSLNYQKRVRKHVF
jgi:hypothetical protein